MGYPALEEEEIGKDEKDLGGRLSPFLEEGIELTLDVLILFLDQYLDSSIDSSRFVVA